MRTPQTRGGYGMVLVLIVITYVLALLTEERWMVAVLLFVQTGTVWQTLRVSKARAGLRLIAGLVFLLALVAALLNLFARNVPLIGWTFLASSALYLVAPFSIVRDLGRHRGVNQQTMLGALAAYLLIGMAFAFAYECVAAIQPGPLFGERGDGSLADVLFFSFVTMTTTGYGDLVPATNPAQSIAVLETLVGTLFLVTAVAKVVDKWRPSNWEAENGDRSFAGDDAPGPDRR
ncbi:potassium channel family protein [Actinoplanes aureus]|uniref:Two pore domain potassium channel family protein n=1 Tax=Actinoplanes aureus TaxID=2792083 RepID=A0A931G6F4_9ACTN|nr:potassium channel family protein [Actinoplanes aureus]MBG0567179.1 two pore domain potassium channel family protein [Actinoplanes aureus]